MCVAQSITRPAAHVRNVTLCIENVNTSVLDDVLTVVGWRILFVCSESGPTSFLPL